MSQSLFTHRSVAATPDIAGAGKDVAPAATLPFPELFAVDDDGEFIIEGESDKPSHSPQARQKIDESAAIESMPHLVPKIIEKWGTRDFNTFVQQLFLDTGDGARKGFPFEAVRELNFLLNLNLLIRAEAAAPLLDITVTEACKLIAHGDLTALGHATASTDVWSSHVAAKDKARTGHAIPSHKNFPPHRAHTASNHTGHPRNGHALHTKPSAKWSAILNEAPPLPPTVRIDLTAPRPLRTGEGFSDADSQMEWGFFRCLAKELGSLKLKRLMLSNLGDASSCDWLPAAIRFCKQNCQIPDVVLHVDLLTSTNAQIAAAMESGLDGLVINLNIASGKWRARAEEVTKSNPGYFKDHLLQLLQRRDELAKPGSARCLVSVIEIGRRDNHLLHLSLSQLSRLQGISAFEWDADENTKTLTGDKHHHGDCHCWAPFIEAHVRTNGHLVACAQDYAGHSFMADLKQVTFMDAWLSQMFRKTRHQVLLGKSPGTQCEICHHRAANA